jgi:GNAT superfamily N-acetyltransferase
MSNFQIRNMTIEDLESVIRWADDEGWEPGLTDAQPFFAADPTGFWVGEVDGQLVSAMSAVTYPTGISFLGFYIVVPEHRGTGLGWRLFNEVAIPMTNAQLGDAVPQQVDTYKKVGFRVLWWNARFVAEAGDLPAPLMPASNAGTVKFKDLVAFDTRFALGPREEFLREWTAGEGREAVVTTSSSGDITGFAAVRPTSSGFRVGPLFADSATEAETLLLTLADGRTGPIAVDAPLPNGPAIDLYERLGMTRSFETARVLRGPEVKLTPESVFGITSLELG